MDYSEVLDSYASLRDRMKELMAPRARPYADMAGGVFGFSVPQPDSDAGPVAPLLIVWMKFGRVLTEIPMTFGTLAELNGVALSGQPMITYRSNGIPSAVDYSGAASGYSRTYTVSAEGYVKTPRSLTLPALSQYRGLDWPFLIGEMNMDSIPQVGP